MFEKLGFKTLGQQNSSQVGYELLPAFNISATDSKIEHIRYFRLPDDTLLATMMQWVQPKTELKGTEDLNAMTLSVNDVEAALERARGAGMEVEPAEYRRLPVFGEVLVGAAYIEGKSCRVEFCCFTNLK